MYMYGHQGYQYNEPNELANQVFAHQALTPSLPYSRSSDPHTMPAPSGAPWNVESIPWGMNSPPQLVQFTGQSSNMNVALLHSKRKSLDVEPAIPAKQFITEEKMAAHFNSLHISSSHSQSEPSQASDEVMDVGMESIPTVSTPTDVSKKLKGHKIVLSEEVKRLKTEPLLPPSLLERLEKPQMSLVVWQPRDKILGKLNEVDENQNKETEPEKRKGLLVCESSSNNTMDIEM